jgi:type I restriction enzyme S subunit
MNKTDAPYPTVAIGAVAHPDPGSFKIGPFGSSLKKDELVDSGIAVVGIENVLPNRFVPKFRRFVTPEKFNQLSDYVIRKNDILVTTMGTIGRACVVPDGIDTAIIDSHLFRMRIDESKVHPPYLCYAVNGYDSLKRQIESMASGAIMAGLSTRILKACTIPLPPLAEQERIATILNEQMAAVEPARAAAEIQLDAAKALPGAYLRAVFNSPEAQAWPRKAMREVSELLPSRSIATDGDVGVQAITTACLTETGFAESGVKNARMWAADAAECVVSAGEVLIARSNTPDLVGRVAMFAGEPPGAVASDLTVRIRPSDGLCPEFLTRYLSFLYLAGYWKERAGGASGSMKKITRGQIQAEEVPVPPIDAQRQLAAVMNEQMRAVDQTRTAIEEDLDAINKLPVALLRRAFSGEL